MNVKIFQASTLTDALQKVREEFGPHATVLETETRAPSFWNRLWGRGHVEVTAIRPATQKMVAADSGFEPNGQSVGERPASPPQRPSTTFNESYRHRFKQFAADDQHTSLLEAMIGGQSPAMSGRLPATLFGLYNALSEADVDDQFARELIEDVQRNSTPAELSSAKQVRDNTIRNLLGRIRTVPQINTHRERRIIALIGPTGVGKTTTIAKLAANLRLRDKRRVGLITVDTYRIAAVDQLRAYAQIIDLPMEVVTTPREMRTAITKMSNVDIVLIDTAGRSSHDEIQIQELKSMLAEAQTDEVQLVLSSVAGGKHLMRMIEQFGVSRPTSLLLTKLDEVSSFGHLLPILCDRLPLSYTTHGQNVPDDIQPANPKLLVESILA